MIKKLKSRGNIQSLPAFSKLSAMDRFEIVGWRILSASGRDTSSLRTLSVTGHKQSGVVAVSFGRKREKNRSKGRDSSFRREETKRARTRRRGSSALVVAAHASTASRRMRRQRRGACVGDGQERAVGIDRRLAARAQSFTSRQADCVATAT